jgi:hypothetical protein
VRQRFDPRFVQPLEERDLRDQILLVDLVLSLDLLGTHDPSVIP